MLALLGRLARFWHGSFLSLGGLVHTAHPMAETCRRSVNADIGVGVTGSFGNVDPNNSDSIPGEVFFAISTSNLTRSFHCVVPVQSSRLAYKMFMADVIADALIDML